MTPLGLLLDQGVAPKVVVTTDADFSAIVARSRQRSPAVITLRLGNPTAEQQIAALEALLRKLGMDKLRPCLIALEQHRYRRRPLPVRPEPEGA